MIDGMCALPRTYEEVNLDTQPFGLAGSVLKHAPINLTRKSLCSLTKKW